MAVAISYRQICIAYPTGGGSYTVSRKNIGRTVSLVAASALLIDYVMTVAVSTSSAVEQIVSAFPVLFDERVLIGVAAISLIAIANLRGLREAGNIFAAPTYLFIGSALIMIVVGVFRIVVLGEGSTYGPTIASQLSATRRTAQRPADPPGIRRRRRRPDRHRGDRDRRPGIQAARGQERRDHPGGDGRPAGDAVHRHHVPRGELRDPPDRLPEKKTVIAQVAQTVYGDGILFYLFQAFTALLLFLAANTSFNAFPRLLAILAGDGLMPRQFALRGDRLAFSTGSSSWRPWRPG